MNFSLKFFFSRREVSQPARKQEAMADVNSLPLEAHDSHTGNPSTNIHSTVAAIQTQENAILSVGIHCFGTT